MSYQATKAVLDGPRSIRGPKRAVLAALAEWADASGSVVYQDGPLYIDVIAARAGCASRTAVNAIKWLEERGYLTVGRAWGRGRQSTFKVDVGKLRKDAETEKGAGDAPFIGRGRDNIHESPAPFSVEKGASPASIPCVLNEPYLNHEDEGIEGELTRARAERSPLPLSTPPDPSPPVNRLSKEYFARRPASSSATTSGPPAQNGATQLVSVPTGIPPGFEVSAAMAAWAEEQGREHGVELDGKLLGKKFVNYFRHGKGRGTELDDWPGRWERWVLDDIDYAAAKAVNTKVEGGGTANGAGKSGRSETASERMVRQYERLGQELQAHTHGGNHREVENRARPPAAR